MKKQHYIIIAVIGLIGLALILTPKSSPRNEAPPATRQTAHAKTVKEPPALPKEYLVIAETLAQKLHPNREQFTVSSENGGEAEALAKLHGNVLNLKGVQSQRQDLNYIADIGAQGFTEYVDGHRRIQTLPDPPGVLGDLVKAVAFNHFAGPVAALKPLANNLTMRGNLDDEKQSALRTQFHAMESVRAASLLLAKIAAGHSPETAAHPDRIRIDFDEGWGGSQDCDWLMLFNDGPEIANVTVRTKLVGGQSDVRENVHFVARWPAKSWLHTRYDMGVEIADQRIWQTTVLHVQSVELDVWSPTLRCKSSYAYDGKERDKDIVEICKPLKLSALYTPYEAGIIFDTKSKLTLTMTGVPRLPATRVTAIIEGESKQKAVTWNATFWNERAPIEFKLANDAIDFVPERLGIRLEFPPYDAAWEGKLKFK